LDETNKLTAGYGIVKQPAPTMPHPSTARSRTMIYPPLPPSALVENWMERHRNPMSFYLHLVGIPPTILGVLLVPVYGFLLSLPIFLFALAIFVCGYLIQFLGHALEGTDPGEIIYFKRKLGWNYVEIAPSRRGAV
jgi:hypothetical protein